MLRRDRFFSLGRKIAQVEFNKSIAGCYRDGNAEYDSVGVLLLTWREDDMNCKEKEVNALEQVLVDHFNFRTEQYEIPPTESEEMLFARLKAFIRCYDSPSKLGIIYYGGHAERVENAEGSDLELFARRTAHGVAMGNLSRTNTSLSDISLPESPLEAKAKVDIPDLKERPQQLHVSFKKICEQLKTSETDILMVVDSCYAAGAFTDQPFGGRKCELFCSIAEKDWARAPGQEGSFTKILTTTLVKMIKETPEGFSTSDLYRQVYQQQHQALKPFHFTQSRFDFGRIWLRPCQQRDESTTEAGSPTTAVDSKYSIDVRFQLTKSPDLAELNKLVKALQYIPFVQKADLQNMHSPEGDLSQFMRTVHLANRLRPLLARIRRRREGRQAQQLRRTDTTPPSSPIADVITSEQFLEKEPRNVGLFDWSRSKAVTPHDERLSPGEYFDAKTTTRPKLHDLKVPTKVPEHPTVADAALQVFSQKADAEAPVKSRAWATDFGLSQRSLDGLVFFAMGVLAPTVIRWAAQGSASPFAATAAS